MARYKDAIDWMVTQDDTEWAHDPDAPLSVTASLTADLFDKDDEQVRADVLKGLKKRGSR